MVMLEKFIAPCLLSYTVKKERWKRPLQSQGLCYSWDSVTMHNSET